MVTPEQPSYAARLDVDYPERLDRFTSFFRIIWIIPIAIVMWILYGSETWTVVTETGEVITRSSAGITSGLFFATLLLILFREKYPRWWFDFSREFARFATRIGAYLFLLTDRYPSTDEQQAVRLDLDYPDVQQDLNRWLPLVKWLLAIPHYIVLFFLFIGAIIVAIIAWFAILFTASYPRGLFDYVVGVFRWGLRVDAYAFLLITDAYPPFSLK